MPGQNKKKIFNDPIYGFITLPSDFIFDLIEHPYFQRLRRISQLGLSYLVYPGAYHTRFHHALGAMHLMRLAVDVLRDKGHDITNEEREAVLIGILLHDIGHGPFSHALEHSIVNGVNHEHISLLFMDELNRQFQGRLTLAIQIFRDEYHKKFLHQLISSQLDVDRLDYLRRDSFYSGVSEGTINTERLLTMLNVADDQLVIDAKGIYSVEKFLIARTLMYWQVYLHKAVLSAEFMLVKALQRAKELVHAGQPVWASTALASFLQEEKKLEHFQMDAAVLKAFSRLDDTDILLAVKEWSAHPDPVLRFLANGIVNRKLLKVHMSSKELGKRHLKGLADEATAVLGMPPNTGHYLVFSESISNHMYNPAKERIKLLNRDGSVTDVADAASEMHLSMGAGPVKKHFLCYPKEITGAVGEIVLLER